MTPTIRRAAAVLLLAGTVSAASGAPAQAATYTGSCADANAKPTSWTTYHGSETYTSGPSYDVNGLKIAKALACIATEERAKVGLKPLGHSYSEHARTDLLGGIARGLLSGKYSGDMASRRATWCGQPACAYYEFGRNFGSSATVWKLYESLMTFDGFRSAIYDGRVQGIGLAATEDRQVYSGTTVVAQKWRIAMGGRW